MIDRLLKPNGHRWTNEQIRTLMSLWDKEQPISEIASQLSVSKNATQKMITRLRGEGIPLKRRTRGHIAGHRNNPWSQSQIEYLIRRRMERATSEEIANELDRSIYGVSAMIQTLRKEGVRVAAFGSGCRRKWNPVIAMASLNTTDNN